MKKQTSIQSVNIPRLSKTEFFVLEMLVTAERALYGLEMVSMSGKLLSRGSIYVTLGRLKDKGFVDSKIKRINQGGAGKPGVFYKPTTLGADLFRALKLLSESMKAPAKRKSPRKNIRENLS